jgi:uncharacterized membrane-anchored protein
MVSVAAVACLVFGGSATAQSRDDRAAQFAALRWQQGPRQGDLGGIASITIPAGHRFLGRGDAGRFMELNENPSDGSELGVLINTEALWFVVFEFSRDGYVKDDDRDLDADAILSTIKQGNDYANKLRRERGWARLDIVGWQQRPFYDPRTNNLTWAISGSTEGRIGINHSTRLLGRRGVMRANLVLPPDDVGTAIPAFNALLTTFSFNAGERYAEFRRGDRVAEYGLTGLVVGGAGVALVKSGLLQKFWKLIVIGFIALAGALKRFVSSLGRGREPSEQHSHV